VIALCKICSECKVAFIKTSTGYGFVRQKKGLYSYAGATEHFLTLMLKNIGKHTQVKAAGGIRNLDDLLHMKQLGVTRIGATATKQILDEAVKRGYQ
jgi:deoxyribose-phosphate aldolase